MTQKKVPAVSPEVAARIEQCDIDYCVTRIETLRRDSENPYGVNVRQYGTATALMVQANKNSLFNRVGGMSQRECGHIDTIVAWYKEQKVRCRFDIVPSNASSDVLKRLTEQGLYQSGFYSALYGVPQAVTDTPRSDIQVHSATQAEKEICIEVYINGFQFPAQAQPFLRTSMQNLFDHPKSHFFLARVNMAIAGVGLLFVDKGIGYLATATTLPAFRGYGCQQALLQARVARAVDTDCDLVVGHTNVASISQYNMEKQGLRIAYTKAIWTEYTK